MTSGAIAEDRISIRRLPKDAIQPHVVVGEGRNLHVVFYRGEAGGGDLFYTTSKDEGRSYAKEQRVNSVPKSAISAGTIRGAHLTLGRRGRVHVAWNGTSKPGSKERGAPMLYTFLDEKTGTFAPQRNLMTKTRHLDGGGSVAQTRVAMFTSFGTPRFSTDPPRRVTARSGSRSRRTTARPSHPSSARTRPRPAPAGLLAAWETREDVYFGPIDYSPLEIKRKTRAAGRGRQRKHPSIATNQRGEVPLVWTEGTGWNRGGSLAWQLYDKNANPIDEQSGKTPGIAVWSFRAVFAKSFTDRPNSAARPRSGAIRPRPDGGTTNDARGGKEPRLGSPLDRAHHRRRVNRRS